jgi:hypothetical protein
VSLANLLDLWNASDVIDRYEGELAYQRYHQVMTELAGRYEAELGRVVAAFAATSPNSDYLGNVRSVVTMLEALRRGLPCQAATVSTYRACRDRAWTYLTGEVDFMATVRGPKIRAFYQNIMNPFDPEPVTIDGHMVAAHRGSTGTMKDNIPSRGEYHRVALDVRLLADRLGRIPNAVQATLWFTRKRLLRVVYQPQLTLRGALTRDHWGTLLNLDEVRPYPLDLRAAAV